MAEGNELPRYLGKFDYDELDGYIKAINAVENAVESLSVTMSGAFLDNSHAEPQTEDLIDHMDDLAEANVILMDRLSKLIEKARERSNG